MQQSEYFGIEVPKLVLHLGFHIHLVRRYNEDRIVSCPNALKRLCYQ